jgi:hypothetical protein
MSDSWETELDSHFPIQKTLTDTLLELIRLRENYKKSEIGGN